MSKECHGDPQCDAPLFCECLPEGVKVVAGHGTVNRGWKVAWVHSYSTHVAHCKNEKKAIKKARQLNKKAGKKEFVAVRVTTKTKVEILEADKESQSKKTRKG